jgi:hypothetical protein
MRFPAVKASAYAKKSPKFFKGLGKASQVYLYALFIKPTSFFKRDDFFWTFIVILEKMKKNLLTI